MGMLPGRNVGAAGNRRVPWPDWLTAETGLGAIEERAVGCKGKAECVSPIKRPLKCSALAPWVVCSFVSTTPYKGSQIAATCSNFDPAAQNEGLIKRHS